MNPIDADSPGKADAASAREVTLYQRLGGRERLNMLLRRFYAGVRQQNLIGPIFNRQINDWPAHLEKIADFWSNVTGGPVRYSGPMPFTHVPLGLDLEHFDAWLDLWRRHCRAHIGGAEAKELIAAAGMIGERIRWVIERRGETENGRQGTEDRRQGTEG
ncbi:MAG: truncated hemoglobin [Opitutaceae bacterium]